MAAPSVHNTQPWHFVSRQGVIGLFADPSRQLVWADPAGREMVISCGAALFNARLAVRHLGFTADVRLLPDPSRPCLLAEIRWGPHAAPTRDEELLYRSIPRRHTHRGPFTTAAPPLAVADLVPAARQERADLRIIYDPRRCGALAGLIRDAEHAQRSDPRFAAETALWARLPGEPGRTGVPVAACPRQPDDLEFPTRGFNRGTRWGFHVLSRPGNPHAVGAVAVLTTCDDRRESWVRAGQALQRALLQATANGVSAAFHTQPLELPGMRERIRTDFAGGAFPQMLLRLGRGGHTATTPRLAFAGILDADS